MPLISENAFKEFEKNLCMCYGYEDDGEINVLLVTKDEANAHKDDINKYVNDAMEWKSGLTEVII